MDNKGKSLNDLQDKYFGKECSPSREEYEKQIREDMNNEKYYTPEITEFHVGFEYEYKAPIGWVKEKLGWQNLDDMSDLIFMNHIRVKFLDAEDVVKCGWKETENIDEKYGSIKSYYYKGEEFHCFLSVYPDYKIRIAGGEHSPRFIFFHGTIKNISELKQLMKILNIK